MSSRFVAASNVQHGDGGLRMTNASSISHSGVLHTTPHRRLREMQTQDTCGVGAVLTQFAECRTRAVADHPMLLRASQAVGVVQVGPQKCTGVLLGNTKGDKYFLTAAHCIEHQEKFDAADRLIKAKQAWVWLFRCGVPSKFRVTDVWFINRRLDYAILKINAGRVDFTQEYSFLRLRRGGPTIGENVVVPHYTQRHFFRFSTGLNEGNPIRIQPAMDVDTCKTEAPRSRVTYAMSGMDSAAAGAPLISVSDGAVVGIHVCGNCANGMMNSALSSKTMIVDLDVKSDVLDFASSPGLDDDP